MPPARQRGEKNPGRLAAVFRGVTIGKIPTDDTLFKWGRPVWRKLAASQLRGVSLAAQSRLLPASKAKVLEVSARPF